MTEIISVKFKNGGKVYYFEPNGVTAKTGDDVIVETSKGLEYAICADGNHMVEDTLLIPPLRPVIRVATEDDKRRHEENCRREKEAFEVCEKKIAEHGLDMKLVDVEYGFDGNKILFFFTSDGRVDFRDLVKDLAGVFKTRIELRQIGVRDEAKMLGGLGICGRPFCCSQFLDDFHPVSIKMAKTQGLSLNPTKISGTCGRLMCCLKYEQCAYEDLVKGAPKVDAFVETPAGKASVTAVNLLRRNAKVRLEDSNDTTLKTFSFDEIEVLGGKGRRAEYIAAREAGDITAAGFKESVITSPLSAFAAAEAEKKEQEEPLWAEPAGAQQEEPSAQTGQKRRHRRKKPAAHGERPVAETEKASVHESESKTAQDGKKDKTEEKRRPKSHHRSHGQKPAAPEKQTKEQDASARSGNEGTQRKPGEQGASSGSGKRRRYYRPRGRKDGGGKNEGK